MTQIDILRKHFDGGLSLTVGEALSTFGIYALSQRCGELKRDGYPITGKMETTPSGARVMRYRKG